MSLYEKVALVTGASRGIFFEVAHALASKGATVVVTATSQASAEKFENSMKEIGFKARGLDVKISDIESIQN
ncbi:SDR family NAD(P)-dependent oxidoreductase, partial [Francisella tularensis subsp. holarctica]|uniref:SDR family NAD(P)-dependent oxidoreductase n=1 Tax=Francisella tularensis TaxID=263 RepID=UPI0023819A83